MANNNHDNSDLAQYSTVSWSTGEAVTVNTRALIDKVLARYSAKYTVLRELFQNAADADAKNVVLKWESQAEDPLPTSDDDVEDSQDESKGRLTTPTTDANPHGKQQLNGNSPAKPPAPPPPYYERPVQTPPPVSASLQIPKQSKFRKTTKSFVSRLKATLSHASLSNKESSSSIASSILSSSAFPPAKFSTTSTPEATPPDLSAYISSPAALRGILYEPHTDGTAIKQKLYHRLIVQNDGKPFAESDWARLKRIAEGNPDETKIGAFGVGFYSVFSECDEPTVFSGGHAMAFFWDAEAGNGNQLMTRTAKLPLSEKGELKHDGWTVLSLPYRTPTPLPDLPELVRFLATSLMFVRLESIAVYVDGLKLLGVEKREPGSGTKVEIPKGMSTPTASIPLPANVEAGVQMKVTKAEMRQVEMRAVYVKGIFTSDGAPNVKGKGRKSDDDGPVMESMSLEITTAHVTTQVDPKIAGELTRAILKQPPKETTLSIVAAAFKDQEALQSTGVFSRILPLTTPQNELTPGTTLQPGQVFIGFQTHQTTGFQCHLSTHSVIPTVERENIDFNARYVKDWNVELMKVAGVLARCMYQHDLARMIKAAGGNSYSTQLEDDAKRLMQKYAFRDTTPSSLVGQILKKAFFDYIPSSSMSPESSIYIMSSKGIKPALSLSLPISTLSGATDLGKREDTPDCDWLMERFLVNTPIVTRSLLEASPTFISSVNECVGLKTITNDTISNDFKGRNLTVSQAEALISWLVKRHQRKVLPSISQEEVKKILRLATVSVSTTTPVTLGKIESYVNPKKSLGKSDLPLPHSCCPIILMAPELQQTPELLDKVLGWKELGVTQWVKHICQSGVNLQNNAEFCKTLLRVINENWSILTSTERVDIKVLLGIRQCIPTRAHGICIPSFVHFENVKWAVELPVLHSDLSHGENGQGLSHDFLAYIGVRKSVELKTILQKLMRDATSTQTLPSATGNKAPLGHQRELIDYLLSSSDPILPADMMAIKKIPFCSGEGCSKLFKPDELYEPNEDLRQLGLPILEWAQPWNQTSFAAKKILEDLGLRRIPDLKKLAEMAGKLDVNEKVREKVLQYMLEKWDTNNYTQQLQQNASDIVDIRFLPIDDSDRRDIPSTANPWEKARLANIKECYSHPRAGLLGFHVLRTNLISHAGKFGISEHPPLDKLVEALIRHPPVDDIMARQIFSYMAYFNAALENHHIEQLQQSGIVPVSITSTKDAEPSSSKDTKWVYKRPINCYLSGTGADTSEKLAPLFDYVDFGYLASQFLLKLGAKHVPTDLDLATLMVNEPSRVLDVLGIPEYVSQLKKIARNHAIWRAGAYLGLQMTTAAFLISEQVIPEGEDEDGNEIIRTVVRLAPASEILVVGDDYNNFRLFRSQIMVCPFEDVLEKFYRALGSRLLSGCVQIAYDIGTTNNDPIRAESLRKLIQERTPLFFSEHEATAKLPIKDWLASMSVVLVRDIRLERRVRAQHTIKRQLISIKQSTTAAVPEEVDSSARYRDGKTLVVVSGKWSHYDIARALIIRLCRNFKPGAVYLMDCLLREDLKVLEERGYNVKRILRQKEEEAKLMAIHEDTLKLKTKSSHGQQIPMAVQAVPISTSPAGPSDPVDMSPTELEETLKRAVQGTKQYTSAFVSSQGKSEPMTEPATYCDHIPGHQLIYHETLSNGMMVYLEDNKATKSAQAKKFRADFETFSKVAATLAGMFDMPVKTIHLCYEPTGKTIGFNSGNSIFLNLHFWLKLGHDKKPATVVLPYWFMVLCHELAHNIVGPHNAAHSYHTENLAALYIPILAHHLSTQQSNSSTQSKRYSNTFRRNGTSDSIHDAFGSSRITSLSDGSGTRAWVKGKVVIIEAMRRFGYKG